LTYHNDTGRTGQNLNETILTPANVNPTAFGRLFTLTIDGKVDGQPLYASSVGTANGVHNLLIVVTEHDSAYAFDADTGAPVWHVSVLGSGETTATSVCYQVVPEIGITSTPVIDRTQGPDGAIFLVAMSADNAGSSFQRLHALDLATGAELFGGPANIQASFPGTGDNSSGGFVMMDPAQYEERAALLLLNGTIYTTWSSHCDYRPYTGWVIAYSETTLAQTSVLNLTPNGFGGAVWMSGAGPAADSSGNVYFLAGNGDFDTTLNANGFPSYGDFGNAFVKASTAPGLAVADYFDMYNQALENPGDIDLGSGGALLLPDMSDAFGTVWHLAAGAGKDSNIYVVNRDSMGKFNPTSNNIYQELAGVLPGGIWSMPAYFNNRLYYGPVGNPIYAFQFSNAKLSTSAGAQTATSFEYPGATPSVSANNTASGIVWAAENASPAVLHAYDANTLIELYNSNQAAGGRDNFGAGNKFITPTIANGKVYVGTTTGVGVFGLLNPNVAPPVLSPAAGSFTTPQSLTLSDTSPGAVILYTTDGSTPTILSAVYSSPITVNATTTISAIAAAGGAISAVTTGVYTIQASGSGAGTGVGTQWTGLSGQIASKIAVGMNSDGRLEVFVRGTDNALWTTSQTSPGGVWSGWQSLGGALTGDPVVGTNADGRLEIFALGAGSALWHLWQTTPASAVWYGWVNMNGAFTGDPAVALNANGRLEVVARGSDNALWDNSQIAPGGNWSGWTSLGGVIASNPALAINTNGLLQAFALGSDYTLWTIAQTSPGAGWEGWRGMGGSLTGDPVAGVNQDGRIEVFVPGSESTMWHTAQTAPGGSWSTLSSLGGSIASDAVVAVDTNGQMEVFALGTDTGLWHASQTTAGSGTWSGWTSLGVSFNIQPAVRLNSNGILNAFDRGAYDQVLYAIAQASPGTWN
jgi:hypothetical protein